MTNDRLDAALEARARRRVGARIGFTIHALVFVLVNVGLFAINALDDGPRWHVFPLAGWGLGLAIHGLAVLLALSGWRERAVAREVEALRRR